MSRANCGMRDLPHLIFSVWI